MERLAALTVVLAALAVIGTPAVTRADENLQARVLSWTQRDGVPPAITAITQDPQGYLWLASSAAGLVRFDGTRFEPWESRRGPALPPGGIYAMTTSRDGSVWLGYETTGGIWMMRPDGSVTSFGMEDGIPAGTRVLHEDRTGAMWAGGSGGLSKFSNGRWARLTDRLKVPRPDAIVNAVYEDRHGDVWIGAVSGVYRWLRERDVFERIALESVFAFAEDENGTLWASDAAQGFERLSVLRTAVAKKTRTASAGFKFLRDRRGWLWVATRQAGLLHIHGRPWNDRAALGQITQATGLTSDRVLSLFEDQEGNIWVGTEEGLNQISAERPTVITAVTLPSQYATALAVSQDPQRVWIGSTQDLYEVGKGGTRRYSERDGLPSARILSLHRDKSGVLWVASDHGIARRNTDGSFDAIPLPDTIRVDQIRAMASDNDGGLWLCDHSALFRWADNKLTMVRSASKTTGRPTAVHADRNGRLWVGFSNGEVLVYDSGRIRPSAVLEALQGAEISAIHVDTTGVAWFATANGLFSLADGRVAHLSEKDGLPGRHVRVIAEDSHGFLWASISGTLVRFDADTLRAAARRPSSRPRFVVFDETDGLRGVPRGAGPDWVATRDGHLWFTTTSGVVRVDPSRITMATVRPPIVRSLLVDGTTLSPEPVLRLPPRRSRITINYASLTLTAPGKVRYRFRLDGFDNRWIDAGAATQAVYANVPPGDYRFRVAAAIDNHAWTESAAPLALSIAPAFYQTWWFLALSVCAAGGAVISGWKLRARHMRRQFNLVLAERARISRDIHDTMLQGMIGVALQCQGVSQTLESSPMRARAQLDRARECLEHYVRETRRFIFEMRTTESFHLADGLRQSAAMIPADSRVDISLTIQEPFPPCASRTERHLLRIAQEAIANALRHSSARHIHVDLKSHEDSVQLRVVDDGIGFDTDTVRSTSHWGLITMQERAEQIGGHLGVSSARGSGTTVEVTAPRQLETAGNASEIS